MRKFTIPPIEDYRKHLLLNCAYINAHLLLVQLGKVPAFDVEKLIDFAHLKKFMKKIEKAGSDGLLQFNVFDVALNYTIMLFVNRLLVSPYDEAIVNFVVSCDPRLITWDEFNDFRDTVLTANTHLLKDIETKFDWVYPVTVARETIGQMTFE